MFSLHVLENRLRMRSIDGIYKLTDGRARGQDFVLETTLVCRLQQVIVLSDWRHVVAHVLRHVLKCVPSANGSIG